MKVIYVYLGSLIALICILFSSCAREGDIIIERDIREYCPDCSDVITWEKYGRWRLKGVGYDGALGNGIPVHLENTCGWEIFGGHAGGIGDTYEVFSCEGGVKFAWAYGQFSYFRVSEGWTGSTLEGIKIGDNLDTVLDTYPDMEVTSPDSSEYSILETRYYSDSTTYTVARVKAKFSTNQELVKLTVKK